MPTSLKDKLSKKWVFIAVGLLNIAIFHLAIFRLWFFLFDSSNRVHLDSELIGWLINTSLILFFSIPHSLLLNSKTKQFLFQYVPQKLYSTLYSLHASAAIILMDLFWVDLGKNLINWSQLPKTIILLFYILSWLFMFWSMLATGLFKQSGIEDWWNALRNRPVKNSLLKDGPYQLCRHPIYASFLGMIWFTPNMSIDRLFLAILWSAYILIGASLKERRLRKNKAYQQYSINVPAFPFIPKKMDNILTYKIWGQIQ